MEQPCWQEAPADEVTGCTAQVHGLQIALNNKGYYCGEDDCVWWQFGMDTYSSLLTFQVRDVNSA